jgi:hypothetical protein
MHVAMQIESRSDACLLDTLIPLTIVQHHPAGCRELPSCHQLAPLATLSAAALCCCLYQYVLAAPESFVAC